MALDLKLRVGVALEPDRAAKTRPGHAHGCLLSTNIIVHSLYYEVKWVQRAIRRGSFVSVADLVRKIDRFIEHHNANAAPFIRTATADSILEKVARLCHRISGTEH